MKYRSILGLLTIVIAGTLAGCSSATKSADVAGDIRKSLDQAGYKDVSVSQDRDKGVVTLTGHVLRDTDKAHVERIAKTIAIGEVVADQIIVLPPGGENIAKPVN